MYETYSMSNKYLDDVDKMWSFILWSMHRDGTKSIKKCVPDMQTESYNKAMRDPSPLKLLYH